jgi:stage IV sporulation protein B
MLSKNRYLKALCAFLAFIILLFCFPQIRANADEDQLYLGGFATGLMLETTDVEVVGVCDVQTDGGLVCPARDSGIYVGDIIEKVNDKEVKSVEDLTNIIDEDYKSYKITIRRASDVFTLPIKPALDKQTGKKKLGVLVKDSINGIGTVTYIDRTKGIFGSLGHPVTDTNAKIIDINGGTIYDCMVYDVKKGVRGVPGELKGIFLNTNCIGEVKVNCNSGVFGNIKNIDYSKLTKITRAEISEVCLGKAQIYTTIKDSDIEKYDISIVKIDSTNKDNKNFVIKIDDENLINSTGGIVQGMSGSPIVQNGKLIGAVTHVFVNDPKRGYAISIDKMLSSY